VKLLSLLENDKVIEDFTGGVVIPIKRNARG